MLHRVEEVVGLLTILVDHQFHVLATTLSQVSIVTPSRGSRRPSHNTGRPSVSCSSYYIVTGELLLQKNCGTSSVILLNHHEDARHQIKSNQKSIK